VSKKDFVAIAAAFRVTMDEEKDVGGRAALFAVIERIADVCAKSNELFDRKRFCRACGMSGN
jgi:hypothetical protein